MTNRDAEILPPSAGDDDIAERITKLELRLADVPSHSHTIAYETALTNGGGSQARERILDALAAGDPPDPTDRATFRAGR